MMPTVALLADGQDGEWDAFVRQQVGWTHFHLSGWRQVVRDVHRHECLYLVARDHTNAIVGVLPLVRVKSAMFGHYLVSMPFVNHGGPLGSDDAIRALTSHAVDCAERDGAGLLEFRSRRPLPIDLAVSHRKISVLLDIPEGPAPKLFARLDAKLRSQIRKPEKAGVTVRFGHDQVDAFFDVFSQHMRDLGTPTQPRTLFRAIARAFPDDAWFGVAWHDGVPIAGGCGFRWGDEFEITWASALRSHQRLAPNMGLYWGFLARCANEGVRTFNFGRCSPGSGTHRFKQQWGGVDETLWWYGRSPEGQLGTTPSPDEGAFSWGPAVWQHLPRRLATALGPHIVRYLP